VNPGLLLPQDWQGCVYFMVKLPDLNRFLEVVFQVLKSPFGDPRTGCETRLRGGASVIPIPEALL